MRSSPPRPPARRPLGTVATLARAGVAALVLVGLATPGRAAGPAAADAGSAPARPRAGVGAAHHAGKSLLGVEIEAKVGVAARAGEPVRVELVVRDTTGDPAGVSVRLATEPPAVLAGEREFRVRPGAPWRGAVHLSVPADGRWFIDVFTRGASASRTIAGATSIAVVVGRASTAAKPVPGATLKSTPAGERVVSMPSR